MKPVEVPAIYDWRTTDEDEINRRKQRAQAESFLITNRNPVHPVFSNFAVQSGSGMTYSVELRSLQEQRYACSCVDFRISGLGTCKHIEAVLMHLERRFRRQFRQARKSGPDRPCVELDRIAGTLRLKGSRSSFPRVLARRFDGEGRLSDGLPMEVLELVEQRNRKGGDVWVSQEIAPWLESQKRADEARQLRHEYEMKVQSGEWPLQETTVPLFPYQREGMLHLAFRERALLADEMGLGKTIQAIAACALLHRLGKAQRVLVVTPASLKTEWEEQILRFTGLPHLIVFGPRRSRLASYDAPPFFTIVNYEQMMADSLDVNQRLRPDVVILDEAQRIKNWNTKTAQAVKRLRSRYAFVLTGTPIENRIDELHSLMDFLNPEVLGPLFRFNRDFYELDERGRPAAYCNLSRLHERVAPYLIRRRKAEVETELPRRTDHTRLVGMNQGQWDNYLDHKKVADKLLAAAKRRALRKVEMDILQRELATMRMICDTNYIVDPKDTSCPKLAELERILEDAAANGAKVIVFSEWERMLQLVRGLCQKLATGFAWHTGSVPQRKRRAEINAFKQDPDCRVFLSTDSGSTGLNLQNASIVVNCDLPWNPAKLEQRIARAWRKNQTQAVTVYNLVAEQTIEHSMLETLASKQALADTVLDQMGKEDQIQLRGGRQAFLAKLEQLVSTAPAAKQVPRAVEARPADPARAFAERIHAALGAALLQCEERYPADRDETVLFVVVEEAGRYASRIGSIHQELFPPDGASEALPGLEVIDRATADALQRLEAAGLFARTFRASRPLYPSPGGSNGDPAALTPEEQAGVEAARQAAQRHLRLAGVLGSAGFETETREPILRAALELGKVVAIRNRWPEPTEVADCLRSPLSRSWPGDSAALRRLLDGDQRSWEEAVQELKAHFP